MLCCNRQRGKTTTIALKSLHRALTIPNQSVRPGLKIRRVLGHQFSLKLDNGSQTFAVSPPSKCSTK